jgi:hypothetical protein
MGRYNSRILRLSQTKSDIIEWSQELVVIYKFGVQFAVWESVYVFGSIKVIMVSRFDLPLQSRVIGQSQRNWKNGPGKLQWITGKEVGGQSMGGERER